MLFISMNRSAPSKKKSKRTSKQTSVQRRLSDPDCGIAIKPGIFLCVDDRVRVSSIRSISAAARSEAMAPNQRQRDTLLFFERWAREAKPLICPTPQAKLPCDRSARRANGRWPCGLTALTLRPPSNVPGATAAMRFALTAIETSQRSPAWNVRPARGGCRAVPTCSTADRRSEHSALSWRLALSHHGRFHHPGPQNREK